MEKQRQQQHFRIDYEKNVNKRKTTFLYFNSKIDNVSKIRTLGDVKSMLSCNSRLRTGLEIFT